VDNTPNSTLGDVVTRVGTAQSKLSRLGSFAQDHQPLGYRQISKCLLTHRGNRDLQRRRLSSLHLRCAQGFYSLPWEDRPRYRIQCKREVSSLTWGRHRLRQHRGLSIHQCRAAQHLRRRRDTNGKRTNRHADKISLQCHLFSTCQRQPGHEACIGGTTIVDVKTMGFARGESYGWGRTACLATS